jgi:uncharacterized protein
MNPVTIVQDIYAAFGRGDIPAILDHIADDIAWEAWADNFAQRAGVPWLTPQHNKAGVQAFFERVAQFHIAEFSVLSLMSNDQQVAAEIRIEATVPGGGCYRDEEVHVWTFNEDNKLVHFRHYVDTAKHIAAAQGQDTKKIE